MNVMLTQIFVLVPLPGRRKTVVTRQDPERDVRDAVDRGCAHNADARRTGHRSAPFSHARCTGGRGYHDLCDASRGDGDIVREGAAEVEAGAHAGEREHRTVEPARGSPRPVPQHLYGEGTRRVRLVRGKGRCVST